jgi:hypothetical protein
LGSLLGNVTGVLNGASTVFITSLNPVTSYDVFVTTSGDMLIAIGAPTRTPVPGEPGEFITHVDLTIRFSRFLRVQRFPKVSIIRGICFRSKQIPK